jgi:hypothetical protein
MIFDGEYEFESNHGLLYASPGQDVDCGPPADRETIWSGPPVLQATG